LTSTMAAGPTRALTATHPYGQIGELANDWDGYLGVIPKSSATVAEVGGCDPVSNAARVGEHIAVV
jgi:hypothetical protein